MQGNTILGSRPAHFAAELRSGTVAARLRGIENRNKLLDSKNKSDKPTLRTRTERQQTDNKGGQQKPGAQSGDASDDPDRPTLKKRPEDDPNNPNNP